MTAWHSLVDHSADVAACFEAAISCTVPAMRLAALAGRGELPGVWASRLSAIAALHDFGKANAGFQARWNAAAPFVGHCGEALAGLTSDTCHALAKVLPITELSEWSETCDPILAALAHHGRPLVKSSDREVALRWRATATYDPIQALTPLGAAVRKWFRPAFAVGGEKLPASPAFWHAFLGLLTFADWLGSDVTLFPFRKDGDDPDRMTFARPRARDALAKIGFDPAPTRMALATPTFSILSPFAARPMQSAAGEITGRIVILESETGSGKTEAALWRFAQLFAQHSVDGLYFALPTRIAAVSLHKRVCAAVARLWPDPAQRPHVTLAVPGMAREVASDGEGLESPAPDVTEYRNDARIAERWAAERPKRFLAGTIAVGTIDQALLGAVKTKHAHLRAACLLRHLLVVDEVHASDAYMARLLDHLLRFHAGAGGHALLLSATLGSVARTNFLRTGVEPTLADAVAAPYPALWSDAATPVASSGAGRKREIEIALADKIADVNATASRAISAARDGAKVLVVRNLRRDAVATFAAVQAQGGSDLLFSCRGVATLHHGRFAREDRAMLDEAVEGALGKTRSEGGLIVIGTQTLEQSLDIDADLLITDLCPADVLLQRIGRLHRHTRSRPAGFEIARAIVLAPADLAPLIARGAHGMGFFSNGGNTLAFPYPDLVALEATRRLILTYPRWVVPAMNRLLVESATHPEARESLLAELSPPEAWREASNTSDGRVQAYVSQAMQARLRYDLHFDDPDVAFPDDETVSSRLGARDLLVVFAQPIHGPFGAPISQISIPDFWAKGIDPSADLTPLVIAARDTGLKFSVQQCEFRYDATGLSKV
ncbi:MAG: CRISPR-associated helicase Cas3' [Hyphomicrobiales bacterium]|nr:CRISPR-associated helicase Cas3' [Hyphomicrobiales bacterium]